MNRLIAALKALADRKANRNQVEEITQAWRSGQIQLDQAGGAISDTSVSIGGDSNAAIIVGHGNLVLNASSALATLLLQLVQVGHPPRLHQLPPEEVNFHGRQTEERDLIAALQRGSAASICALNGMGGIGKSALAARVGWRVAQLFPDAQLWVRLDGSRDTPLAAAEGMKRVIQALEPLVQIPEGEQEVEGLYRHLLHERRCLIVLDDARDANQVRPLLPPAPSAALITSRQSITLGGTRIRLDALPCPKPWRCSGRSSPAMTSGRRSSSGWPKSATVCRWRFRRPGPFWRKTLPGRRRHVLQSFPGRDC